MQNNHLENEIIVRPRHGMQLSTGHILNDGLRISGYLPALLPCVGKTVEDVRSRLEQAAKAYYGDDVIVQIILSRAIAS